MGAGFTKDHENEKIGALFQAIRREKFQLAIDLISKGAGVNCINYFGNTPLIETCRSNRASNKRGNTVESERERFVRFLISNDCDITKYDIYGWTALMYAEKNGYDNIADILEKKDKRTRSGDSRGKRDCDITRN
ncbi:putative ankyrin repeat domain-containing protein 19 [Mytilus edulis]|uniref:putative ankyrin repeat domain-containing protein 19 n=1 Tax=Mytilus edulis TaxID=6550 RepID=UPI0039EE6D98